MEYLITFEGILKIDYQSYGSCLTLFVPMEFAIKFDTVKPGWSVVYIEGSQVIISKFFL